MKASITPIFQTDRGQVQLEEGTSYDVSVSPELIQMEMTRREKKKYNENE